MTYNWTLATVVMFVATIPEIIAVIISALGYVRTKYLHFRAMFITWFFLWIGNFLLAWAYLTLNTTLYRIGIVLSIPLTYGIMLLVDSVSRGSIDPFKLFLITVASTALVIFAFDLDAVTINTSVLGEQAPALVGRFNAAGSIIFLLAGILWLFYMTKIFVRAPESVKTASRVNLVGAVIAGPGSMIAFVSGFVWVLPGTDYFCISVGALLCAYAFGTQPKLGYVLPFRVYRLNVVNIGAGVPLYDYTWEDPGFLNATLFSGAIKGISGILDESLRQGDVREITFEKGILISQRLAKFPVAFILVATRSAPILKHALNLFARDFEREFRPVLADLTTVDLAHLRSASSIVETCFPFIVTYSETTG